MANQYVLVALSLFAGCAKRSVEAPKMDPALLDAQGTMYITRSITMPQTISPEAQQYLLHLVSRPGANAFMAELSATTRYFIVSPLNTPFPAAVDDSVAVYKELLRTYKPEHIGLYGASTGGIFTAEAAVKIKELKLPLPGASGTFTASGDFSNVGERILLQAAGHAIECHHDFAPCISDCQFL
jgi:hypothetical protein